MAAPFRKKLAAVEHLLTLLQDCRLKKDLSHLKRLHGYMREHKLETDGFLGNYLVPVLVECGDLPSAQTVFNLLPHRNVYSWTSLIVGYIDDGELQHALDLYHAMQQDRIQPNSYTFVALLKACEQLDHGDHDRLIHTDIVKNGLDTDRCIGNTLVDMYGKRGSLTEAQYVFSKLPNQDVVSWTALLVGYAEHGLVREALRCLEQMQLNGLHVNEVTYICSLRLCGRVGDLETGKYLLAEIAKKGLERDHVLGSAIVDMYAKCGSVVEAQDVCGKLPVRDAVSWTALIWGYAEKGQGEEALSSFKQMQEEGISPDDVTFSCSLKACGCLADEGKGQELHALVLKTGLETERSVGNALVDMYGKCGLLIEGHKVFEALPSKDVVSWNTLIKGYGDNHEGNKAMHCFEKMLEEGVKPDATTFTCLLAACSHASLVLHGQEYFKAIREKYALEATSDHYACMIDLLARSGHVHEAKRFLEAMQCLPSAEVLRALLTACKIHGDVELGLRCFQQLVLMNQEDAPAYLLIADIFFNAGRCSEAKSIEEMRKHLGAKKKLASSLLEVNKKSCEFVVGHTPNKDVLTILDTLSSFMKLGGHIPNLDTILRQAFVDEKETLPNDFQQEHCSTLSMQSG